MQLILNFPNNMLNRKKLEIGNETYMRLFNFRKQYPEPYKAFKKLVNHIDDGVKALDEPIEDTFDYIKKQMDGTK